jgi:hypothetical protein
MEIAIALGLGYLIGLPIVLRLIALAQKKLVVDRAVMRAGNNRAKLKNLPKPIWPKWKERLAFTFKDKRDFAIKKPKKGGDGKAASEPGGKFQNRQVFWGTYLLGLLVSVVGAFIPLWWLVGAGYVTFFIAIGMGIRLADPVIVARKNVLSRMYAIAKQKLGQSVEYEENPGAIIRVLEWADYVKPKKVEFDVPDSFGAEGEEGFLRQYNQIFGTETAWVPSDDPENQKPGWDYDAGMVTLHAVPPLPQMAKWSERYVLDPNIAWSFFPVALGVENGVELPNPESGELEYVLGFDVSGEQMKQKGVKTSPRITVSPMVFIGGGTGGGKSLSVDTPVKVIKPMN